MFRILSEQRFRTLIPAGVPAGTPVGNKTGNITRISHDAAIVRPPGRDGYVLVVLTRGYSSVGASAPMVSDISRLAWDVLGGSGEAPPAFWRRPDDPGE
jgi:beta-lactamase class A